MAEFVEGEWKNFVFKMAQPEDHPKILEHLREYFYKDEPMNRHLGQSDAKNNDMDKLAVLFMGENLSFFATDKITGKIAGVRITGISRKDEKADPFAILESEEAKHLIPNILELYGRANTYERLNIDNYGDFLFVSVAQEYRGQGLATEIYKRAINLLKSKGCPAAQSIFTNPHSQKIASNLGFVELARKYFKDFVTLEGNRLLPEAENDEVSIVMTKLLND